MLIIIILMTFIIYFKYEWIGCITIKIQWCNLKLPKYFILLSVYVPGVRV